MTILRILAAVGAWVLLGTGSARPADAAPVVKLGGDVEEADGTVRVRGIVEIADGYHINAHVPDEVFLIPTVLSLEADGVTFHEGAYPEPEAQTFPFSPDKPMLVLRRDDQDRRGGRRSAPGSGAREASLPGLQSQAVSSAKDRRGVSREERRSRRCRENGTTRDQQLRRLVAVRVAPRSESARQEVAAGAIQVGDTIPHFTAVDEFGKRFDSKKLHGHLVLIKSFRAHWCPYCVAELRRWENELRPELDKREVQIVTVSTDSVEELQNRREAHGLQATMLSDFHLKVTDAFGLRNTLFHSAPLGDEQEALPVPASLLVDRDGKVRWMDLAENYQKRTSTDVVLAAVQKHLD